MQFIFSATCLNPKYIHLTKGSLRFTLKDKSGKEWETDSNGSSSCSGGKSARKHTEKPLFIYSFFNALAYKVPPVSEVNPK